MDTAGELTGLVLCGGRSRRMGTDKAVLDLGGSALLERSVQLLRPLTELVLLSTGRGDRYADLGCTCVHDPVPDGGPLAGLAAGLAAARTPFVFLLACDMPRVDGELVRAICERARVDDLDLCVLESERGLEPTCGVFHRRCLPAVEAALACGRRRMNSFWQGATDDGRTLRTGTLRPGEQNALDPSVDRAVNLNTPQELERERLSLSGEDTLSAELRSGQPRADQPHAGQPPASQPHAGQDRHKGECA